MHSITSRLQYRNTRSPTISRDITSASNILNIFPTSQVSIRHPQQCHDPLARWVSDGINFTRQPTVSGVKFRSTNAHRVVSDNALAAHECGSRKNASLVGPHWCSMVAVIIIERNPTSPLRKRLSCSRAFLAVWLQNVWHIRVGFCQDCCHHCALTWHKAQSSGMRLSSMMFRVLNIQCSNKHPSRGQNSVKQPIKATCLSILG